MTISVRCPACGKGHKAPARAAGRTLKCLACGGPMTAPDAEADPLAVLFDSPEKPSPAPGLAVDEEPPERPVRPTRPADRREASPAGLPPLRSDQPPSWRRHLHWLLALAMIPLALSLLAKDERTGSAERIQEALDDAGPEALERLFRKLDPDSTTPVDLLDAILGALPDQRLKGAWLPRTTYAHWGMAVAAAALFLVFFVFLGSDGSAGAGHVIAVGLLTATVGVGLLLAVQGIAAATAGTVVYGGSPLVIIFYIFKFIGFSYEAANDPENGFLLSFVGFTAGVGLCEELVKAVPLFFHREEERGKGWRGLLIWGLASGAGFGIAEGILYSGRYYNGITGPGITPSASSPASPCTPSGPARPPSRCT